MLVPMPTYPLYTAVIAKLGARAVYYRTDPDRGWMPDLDHLECAGDAGDPRARRHRSEQPDRRDLSDARPAARCSTSPTGTGSPILADEVYGDLATTVRWRRSAASIPMPPIISFSSLSKAYLAPGWRTGWMAIGRSPRLDDVVTAVAEAGGRPAVQHRADAVRDHRGADRRPLAPGRVPRRAEGARRRSRSERLNADARRHLRRADRRRSTRCRRVALPPGRTDEDYVLALLRATGVLCVYGSGFRHAAGGRLPAHRVPGRRRTNSARSTT